MKTLINTIASKASGSIAKATLATTITVSSISLSTGIVPVTMKVADKQVSNIEVAEAGWWQNVTYRVGNYDFNNDPQKYCYYKSGNGMVSKDSTTVTCWGYEVKDGWRTGRLVPYTYSLNKACEYKFNKFGDGLWIGDGGWGCYDSYWKWNP